MITELRVRDLATIADVTLPLGPGLNVLTGETGAGKSMLVDALALLLGERADSGSVRPGAAKRSSRASSRASTRRPRPDRGAGPRPRGRPARRAARDLRRRPLPRLGQRQPDHRGVLAELGALLVDLHGQHETQSLLRAEAQRDILDAFAHAEAERAAVAEAHA